MMWLIEEMMKMPQIAKKLIAPFQIKKMLLDQPYNPTQIYNLYPKNSSKTMPKTNKTS